MALKIIVTGAAGGLGRAVVEELRRHGHAVIGCGRREAPGVDQIWDVDEERPPPSIPRADAVIHAAARTGRLDAGLDGFDELIRTNATGTLRVARWCLDTGVERLVVPSGALVYGSWTMPRRESERIEPWRAGAYAVSKSLQEEVAMAAANAGLAVAVLRLSSLWGPSYGRGLVPRLVQAGRETGEVRVTEPTSDAFDLLHVADASRTIANAIERRATGVYNVGGGRVTTLLEVGEACAAATGAKLVRVAEGASRAPRTLNAVDDTLARRDLAHGNRVGLCEGVAEIARASSSVVSP